MEKTIRRFWSGKFRNIDGWLQFIYDKMSEGDKKRKDSHWHRYYRYYNDGDFPSGLKDENGGYITKWTNKEKVERVLNKSIEDDARYFIKKYMKSEDREKFYEYEYFEAKRTIIDAVKRSEDFKYWVEGYGAKNRVAAKIWDDSVKKVYEKYADARKKIYEVDPSQSRYTIEYFMETVKIPAFLKFEFEYIKNEMMYNVIKMFNVLENAYGYGYENCTYE